MEAPDVVDAELDALHDILFDLVECRVELPLRHLQFALGHIGLVEFPGEADQGGVALVLDGLDDRTDFFDEDRQIGLGALQQAGALVGADG